MRAVDSLLKKHPYAMLWTSLLFVFLLLLPAFQEGFFIVDDASLVGIPQMTYPFSLSLMKTFFTPGLHIDFYPVRDLSYWIDVRVLGGTNSGSSGAVYRYQNFFWFCLCAFLLYSIFLKSKLSKGFALFLTLFFVLNAVHFEMILWLSARKDILCIALFLTSVRFYMNWSEESEKNKPSAFCMHLFYLLSLLSKSTFGLAFLFLLLPQKNYGKRILHFCIAAVYAVPLLFIQKWMYSKINDMRFFYELSYRIKGSLEAVGRGFAGYFIPHFNAVDVENWGNWVQLNQPFLAIGLAFWLILFCLVLYNKKNRNQLLLLVLMGLIYAPISALFFPHRNFHSVRYFEAPLLIFSIMLFTTMNCVMPKLCRNSAPILIVLLISLSVVESKNWQSNYETLRKAVELTPQNPSLLSFELTELLNLEGMGRLTPQQIERKQKVEEVLLDLCVNNPPLNLRNGSLCLNYWGVMGNLDRTLQYFPLHLKKMEEALAQVNDDQREKLSLYMQTGYYLKTKQYSKLESPAHSIYYPSPYFSARLLEWLTYCSKDEIDQAKQLWTKYIDQKVFTQKLVKVSLGHWVQFNHELSGKAKSCIP